MQNEPKRDEQSQKGSGGNPGGGSAPQRSRGARKDILDLTNIMGAALWLVSASLTAIVVMLIFIKLPEDCLGDRGQVVGSCIGAIARTWGGIGILSGAMFTQFLVSAMIFRLRNPTITRIGNFVEWTINFVGFFWLICVQVGVESASGVYVQVMTFIRNFTVPTIIWWLVLIVLSVGLDVLTHNLFNAPPTGAAPQGVQRR